MKKIYIFIITVFTLLIASAGYTAGTEEEGSMDSSSTMEMSEDMSGMMGGMHGKGKMHQGMMGHHMMHSGVSPVTIMIQPGMMPMMGHSMMQKRAKDGHKGGGKMKQRQEMMKEHMERMEQRLANIEALLSELVELQKKD